MAVSEWENWEQKEKEEVKEEKKLLLLTAISSVQFFFFFFCRACSASIESPSLWCQLDLKMYSNPFFLPISTSFIKEPITGFCASKCFTSLNKSSIRFLFLIMLFEIGSSPLLKLTSFTLLLVTYRSSSPCISSPKSLVPNRNFSTSSLRSSLTSCC